LHTIPSKLTVNADYEDQ